jgi:hypothetical protein
VKDATTDDKVKIARVVELTFKPDMLLVVCGDARPLEIPCVTGSRSVVTVRLRTFDLMALMTALRDHDCQEVSVEPDDRGLVKFSWADAYAAYAIHIPTCSPDAKLHSKRLATMRAMEPMLAQAAE